MTTPVRVLHPDLSVKLHKLVKRETIDGTTPTAERFKDSDRTLDITKFFSEAGSIITHKSVRQAAGGFTLVFTDKPYGDGNALETIYGLVEPMDGIEIRMSHNHGHANRRPPIIMRGFVSEIGRSQSVDGNGAPMRTVTVQGHDYGKIWQMLRILFRPLNVIGEIYLTSFRLFERFGVGLAVNQRCSEFVQAVVEQIINTHLAGMLPADWPMPRSITVDAIVGEGLTSVSGPQNQEGSIYDILALFTDVTAGFNELYIEDREDTVAAVFRPNPALDLNGVPIQRPTGYRAPAQLPAAQSPAPAAPVTPSSLTPASSPGEAVAELPATVVVAPAPLVTVPPPTPILPYRVFIPASDIVSLEISRSDQDVANYFWVEDPRFELVSALPLQMGAITSAQRATIYNPDYPNNRPGIYGLRPMVVATQMGAAASFASGQNAATQAEREQQALLWSDDRRRILNLTNRDNVLLEHGTVRITGNENVRAGSHVNIGEGALAAPFYVAAVTHEYQPFKGYFTTLTLERGHGFVRRVQAGNAFAPWLLELGAGAPTQPTATGNAAAARTSPSETTPSISQSVPPPPAAGPAPSIAAQPPSATPTT